VRVVNILGQFRNGFRVRVRLKDESIFLENGTEFLVIGDDTVVNDGEFIGRVGTMRMRVAFRRRAWESQGGRQKMTWKLP
jgi:hypothetical protein